LLHSPRSFGLTPAQFAIRPTIRNHSNLKRDVVINTVARLINDDLHKVNLTSPDKVILIDIYQSVCGMSVVDGDWDELKRYNLTELYTQGRNAQTTEA
jgi:tRNA acetyltransferase TAN1